MRKMSSKKSKAIKKQEKQTVELPNMLGRRTRIDTDTDKLKLAFLSDTHFGSKYCAEDKVADAVDEINNYHPHAIFFGGDIIDGYGVYKGQEFELSAHSLPDQLEKAEILGDLKADVYAIDGNHSEAFVKRGSGYPQKIFCEQFDNWHYSGIYHGSYKIFTHNNQQLLVDIIHPNGTGAYALSYPAQKVLRNLPHQTDILALGHYHQTGYFQIPNNGTYTHSIMIPSFQESTPYAQRMGHVKSFIGYVTLEVQLLQNKIKSLIFKLNEMI